MAHRAQHAASLVSPPYSGVRMLTRMLLQEDASGQDALHTQALAAFDVLVEDMTRSYLLELPPGAPYLHMSPAVLLRGALRTSGTAVEAGAAGGKGALHAWLPVRAVSVTVQCQAHCLGGFQAGAFTRGSAHTPCLSCWPGRVLCCACNLQAEGRCSCPAMSRAVGVAVPAQPGLCADGFLAMPPRCPLPEWHVPSSSATTGMCLHTARLVVRPDMCGNIAECTGLVLAIMLSRTAGRQHPCPTPEAQGP